MRYGMQDTNINYITHDGKKRTTRIQDEEYAKEEGIEVTITVVK